MGELTDVSYVLVCIPIFLLPFENEQYSLKGHAYALDAPSSAVTCSAVILGAAL